MKQIERIGVSLDKKLLSAFDKLIAGCGYQSRSEAIRDLIREQISRESVSDPGARAIGVVLVVYEHHSTRLMETDGEAGRAAALARPADHFLDAYTP
jgi:CopG family nickel-responsive transcriptional regulator